MTAGEREEKRDSVEILCVWSDRIGKYYIHAGTIPFTT